MKVNFCLKSYITKFAISFIVALFLLANFLPFTSFINIASAEIQPPETSKSASASPEDSINYTVFMRNATYCAKYQNKVFFIDEDAVSGVKNYTLKAYDIDNGVFESSSLPLTDMGEIIDAGYIDGKFFILATNGIFYVSISIEEDISFDFQKLDSLEDKIQTEDYGALSTYKYSTGNEYFLTLTPRNLDGSTQPELIVVDGSALTVKKYIQMNLTTQENLLKIVAISSSPDDDQVINFLFVYNTTVSYINVNRSSIESIEDGGTLDSGAETTFRNFTLESKSPNTSVSLINTIESGDKLYLFVTYIDGNNEVEPSNSFVYQINFSRDSVGTTISYVTEVNNNLTSYGLVSGDSFVYSTGQQIEIITFNFNEEPIEKISQTVKNPQPIYSYEKIEDFLYYKTTAETYLLNAPWSPIESTEQSIKLNENTDVIVVGHGSIKIKKQEESLSSHANDSEETEEAETKIMEDYLLCFYTDSNGNHIGFIETEKLTPKPQAERQYNKFLKVKPNSALYSLPTKVEKIQTKADDNTVPTYLLPQKLSNIKDNSKIEWLDSIFDYTAANSQYIKVKVNDLQEGYIETDSLIPASDAKDFVITNAYIKEDGTNVYLEANTNSPIIDILKSSKRVRINGARNTKTGFTYITFNDEYGNEFSGYIKTDFVKSDGWSTLQIVGCILIAINVGLLILILYFRETRIGFGGQKYVKEKEKEKR